MMEHNLRTLYNKMIKRTSTDTLSCESETVKVELIVYSQIQIVHVYIDNKSSPRETKTLDITPNGPSGMHGDLYNYRTGKSVRYSAKTKMSRILSEDEYEILGRIIGGLQNVKDKRK